MPSVSVWEGLLSRASLVFGGHGHMEEALRGPFPGAALAEGVSAVPFNPFFAGERQADRHLGGNGVAAA